MAKDPFRYFRVEARELVEGLTQGVLELEKGSASPEAIARMLRLAHTLKGAARVVKQSHIAELAHSAESLLATQREAAKPLAGGEAGQLLQLLDQVSAHVQSLEPASPPGSAPAPADPSPEDSIETVRVEIREIDSLLLSVSEAAVHVGGLRKKSGIAERLHELSGTLAAHLAPAVVGNGMSLSAAILRARAITDELQSELARLARALTEDAERVEASFVEIRDITHRLRLVPARTLFPSLDRAIRDAAHDLGKQVDFEALGGDVQLDAHVLAAMRDALAHVVRNAVTHGIETATERQKSGKPPRGRVRLVVERHGHRVSFACEDDGRGVDLEAVRSAAIRRQLVSPGAAQSLTPPELLALLRRGGLSTAKSLTELSGRGIGLDVARATASRLKGELHIRSEPGRGAAIEVLVPFSIASLEVLVVETSGHTAVIPLDSVRCTLRLRDEAIARSATSQSIVHDGRSVPFLPLDQGLRLAGTTNRRRGSWSAVLVHAGGREAAVGVERLLGTASIVMRALPAAAEAEAIIAGATLDAEGNPLIVLSPVGLIGAAERGAAPDPRAPERERTPVLVVDDSLTTRMLEQSILESAGYEVELAISGEDALEKARARPHRLFIVDVEMPGMDGFGFVAAARSDPLLRDIPSILVTSRSSAEDRRRGEQAGAKAYIVKGEFDQGHLLKTIRGLLESS
ncbi:MAG: response regulator [Deltaproteobacteria bacterium]|nr:response regulator [Deltaproteobacteria bacterium]